MVKDKDTVVPIKDLAQSRKVVKLIQTFRAVTGTNDISANQILALMFIHQEPGISQITLANDDHLDLPTGTVARICAVLSDRGNRGTEGLRLIEITHAPGDYRSTAQVLSKKGRDLIEKVLKICEA